MKGRELHFIAIGGAGMSALALICDQLGARVSGSDRAESSYLRRLREHGVDAVVGHDAAQVPPGAEVVISTAISESNPELVRAHERGQRVLHRGQLLAELCSMRRLIAISGTHGKTTTAGMLVHAMRAIGAEPAFFLGGELPGANGVEDTTNAGWGNGEWVIAEADESDGSFLELEPEISVVTNVELDHHSRWSSRAQLLAAFESFAGSAPSAAVLDAIGLEGLHAAERTLRFDAESPGPPVLELAVPGAHNVLNARAALAALELAGFELGPAAQALSTFPGIKRRQERKGVHQASGAVIYDDYAHHPTEVAATLSALRELAPKRLIAVFQPHLYSRTKALAQRFGAALAGADEVAVLDVYAAREEPVGELEGVSGLDVARAAADRAAEGAPSGGYATLPTPAERWSHAYVPATSWSRSGPATFTSSAMHWWQGQDVVEIEHDYPLSRLTTVRAGGKAELFARPATEAELVELLTWAAAERHAVAVVGSGSNLLVADAGVSGLVLKLAGELTEIVRDETEVVCGGGVRLPSAAAKTAGWGLSGLEFGINIPGTVGGAVRMNANAYGGELAEVLAWVEICTASGVERRSPDQLGFAYRRSGLSPDQVVARASFQLSPADPSTVKATLAAMRSKRREAQPSGIKTFGSTFKNPPPDAPGAEGRSAGQLLEAAGAQDYAHGGARFSRKHANFVENTGEASTADVLAVLAEGRRRVHEQFGIALEPEVEILGEVEWPDNWRLEEPEAG